MSALSWVYYVLGVSLMVGLGAAGLEAMLRASGRGGRWAWLLALAVLVLVPVAPWLRPAAGASPPLVDVLAVPLILLPELTVSAEARAFDALALLPWLWAVASLLFVAALVLSALALRRAARHWREADLEGVPLWISAHTGPAVVGLRRPRIVLPEWVLELSAGDRRLAVLHEREHLRAGDARLLLAGLVGAVLLPWNPVVWWALHRLRGALELDCDERVLRQAGEPAAYGRLLLEVGRRRTERYLLAAAFAEPRVLLERRVRALLRWPGTRRPVRAVLTGAAALLCFGFAYAAPNPLARGARQPAAPEATSLLMASDTPPPLAAKPTFTPFTQAPELQNRDEITKALIAEYPPLLKDAGIGGKVLTWVFIDERGVVANALLKTTSGYQALDSAGIIVAKQMRFAPAKNRDKDVPVWVEIPILFKTDGAVGGKAPGIPAPTGKAPDVPPPGAPPPPPFSLPAPEFTPFSVPPRLQNPDEVKAVLIKAYPPLLKDAGIGGKSLVWVNIDGKGTVFGARLGATSGYEALDQAALTVAKQMRFEPALDAGNKPIPVWVEIPILFQLDGVKKQEQAAKDVALAMTEARKVPQGTEYTAGASSGEKVKMTEPQRKLLNVDEIVRNLVKVYPPELRDAGIGGSVVLRLFVDEKGEVSKALVAESSGRKELDAAALSLAKVYRFAAGPAAWLDIPVKFSSQ